jgi:hypothetical protein
VELAVPSFLWTIIAKVWLDIVEIYGLWLLQHMLEIRTHDTRSTLRLHHDLAPSLIGEVEHLLAHDITRLTRTMGDECLHLEDRSRDTSESIGTKFVASDFLEKCEIPLIFSEDILHTADTWREFHEGDS